MKKSIFIIFIFFIGAITSQVSAQNINIPDANFKKALLNQYIGVDSTGLSVIVDMNRDGEIQQNEADRIRQLILVGNIYNVGDTISDLTGIENFKNLEILQCGFNKLTEIKLDKLTKLTTLSCPNNKLTSLDLTHLKNLTNLYCWNNKITKLDLTQLTLLEELDCSKNAIEELYINSEYLSNLDISYNKLQTLDTKGFKNIQKLRAESNQLKEIKLDNCPKLEDLRLYANALESIDITHCPKLKVLDCGSNNLKSMYLKNGVNNMTGGGFFYDFENNKNLKYICVDDDERGYFNGAIRDYKYTNVIVNSLCLSNIESTFHSLRANARYDAYNNDCSSQDEIFTNLKYHVSNVLDSVYLFPNSEGFISMIANAGIYTLTPIFNHPYFITNSNNLIFTLPTDTLLTKICITPKGNFNDLAVSIIPVRTARPGFSDAQYKVVYKNQGTTTQSGTVTFSFEDEKMNIISSSPNADQSDFGKLTFNFTNLSPFESRSVFITMRTNAPTDHPAVNVNDVLNFSANISAQTDETPEDNTAILYQTVIGSYDPNDKTCLEGDIITPDMVGKRVNYLIRFENTGTANAENVVVTDYIDTTVFDVNSLLVIDASHTCHTQISNGNKVQFVFSDIQLPFTEPDKHGYIAFSILLKDHLQIGDSIKNYADIYFDYNLPITTNEAISEVKNRVITTVKQKISDLQLSVYPNPSKGNFSVELKSNKTTPIQITVIDIEGKIVFTKQYAAQQNIIPLQLQKLPKGTYLVQVQSENDVISRKVVIQ